MHHNRKMHAISLHLNSFLIQSLALVLILKSGRLFAQVVT